MLLSLSPAAELTEIEPSVRVDCSSFQQFVLTHETAVFTFCYRMLGSAGMAETAAETAFLDACPHFPAVSLVDVLAAASRRCREVLQHQGRWRETAISTTDAASALSAGVSDVQRLFNQLPVPEREVMALRYGCKLNFAEIAAILNSSGQAVRDALRQGRWHAANLE